MKGFLTSEERNELLDELKIERERRYADRIRVILLLDTGKTYESIAEHLFLDQVTINNWRKRYQDGGIECLLNDHYLGREAALTPDQLKPLQKELDSKIYPNAKSIAEFILKNFKVKYSRSGVTNLLHRLGYSFVKATPVPGKADRESQEEFIELYERLQRLYHVIFFMDATHPEYAPVISYGWVKTGKRFEVKTNSGYRKRFNICGALEIGTRKLISKVFKTIDQESILKMLKKIRSKVPLKIRICLILDGASYHTADSVKKLAKELNIRLVSLPRYSPNLNLVERIWGLLKKKVLVNRYYDKYEDCRLAITKFLKSINSKRHEKELESLLTEDFQLFST